MKKYFDLLYWALMMVVLSLILMSVMGAFGPAFFLSVMLLPGVLFVKYFSGDISFRNRRKGVLHTVYFVAIVMLIEYLAIIFVYWNLYRFASPEQIPSIILNPVFIWFILGSLLAIEKIIENRFFIDDPERKKYITFISDRKKVSLELDSIAWIESRDYEVSVMTGSGEALSTRMKISQWESVLGDRFLRVHRSFIVNRTHIIRFDAKAVWIGEHPIEISRKYREGVLDKLGGSSGS